MQIIRDHNSDKVTKIGAWLTKLSQRSLALAFMEWSSFRMNVTEQGKCDNVVNMWWKMFQDVYAQIVSDNNSKSD